MSEHTHTTADLSQRAQPAPFFMTTRWAVVQAAGVPGPQRESALGELVAQYQPALKQYLRCHFGVDGPTADDLIQGFLLDKVLKRDLIAAAERGCGKFRTFLLTAVNRYTIDSFRRDGAQKRIPKAKLVALEEIANWDAVPDQSPPGAEDFDNAFVRQVIATAIHRLRSRCQARNQRDVWRIFYHRVLVPVLTGEEPASYSELAQSLDLKTARDARNRLVTAKRILRRDLEALVTEYSADSREAQDELMKLRDLFR